jgi:hypothetical protein
MCSIKTMLKVAFGMLVIAGIGYFTLPNLRTWIIEASPLLLFSVCPISMFIAMKMMSGQNCDLPRSAQPDSTGSTKQRIDH